MASVTTADITDRKGAIATLTPGTHRLSSVLSIFADSGYTAQPPIEVVRLCLGEVITVQIARRSEPHTFAVILRRWIVE
ncbi:hypothetical protein SAMN05216318_10129 [Nitrosomonas eutropha]|nr:hypothetical protein [Nitrosomonas eutropha]SEI37364.1 hypothetical protein SAMN05216318_10129 [Nitrosomonas eutropha]